MQSGDDAEVAYLTAMMDYTEAVEDAIRIFKADGWTVEEMVDFAEGQYADIWSHNIRALWNKVN